MKKTTFISLCMLLVAFTGLHAADTFIAGFETGETGVKINEGWYQNYTWEVTDNLETSGINDSEKCMQITITAQNPDRWGLWVSIILDNPVTITSANRYFKIMAKRSPNEHNMGLSAKGDEDFYFGRTMPAKDGEWCDLVFDLFSDQPTHTLENKEIQEFLFCLGTWDGTGPGVCFLDNIVLSDNFTPRGAREINPGLLINFEGGEVDNNFASFGVQSPTAVASIVTNPKVEEPNSSANCMQYSKPASTVWWHALRGFVDGVVKVEYPNTNLHVMMYIPDGTPVTVIAKSPIGQEVQETIYPYDNENWYDYVVDVSELPYISEIMFRFNNTQEEDWANPAGLYYVDDFVLNDSADPRETISSITSPVFDDLKIYVDNGTAYVSSPELKAVKVYALNGQLLQQQAANNSTVSFSMAKGLYIIEAENVNGGTSSHKVVIQ